MYTHFAQNDRDRLSLLRKQKYSWRDIGDIVGKDASSCCREFHRNKKKDGSYDPSYAHHKAYVKRKYSKFYGMKIRSNPRLLAFVETAIKGDKAKDIASLSPEQIAGRWNTFVRTETEERISHVTIYKYLYSAWGQPLCSYLYSQQYRRAKRKSSIGNKGSLQNRVFIDARPPEIGDKIEFGHREKDFVVSTKGDPSALLTTVEKVSRHVTVNLLENRTSAVLDPIIKGLVKEQNIKSFTTDNDIAFAHHAEYGCPVYFCHPYASWEKGQIEYANRLIRRYIPKKSRLADYTQEDIQHIVHIINNTPRKCLGYRTPNEVYYNLK